MQYLWNNLKPVQKILFFALIMHKGNKKNLIKALNLRDKKQKKKISEILELLHLNIIILLADKNITKTKLNRVLNKRARTRAEQMAIEENLEEN